MSKDGHTNSEHVVGLEKTISQEKAEVIRRSGKSLLTSAVARVPHAVPFQFCGAHLSAPLRRYWLRTAHNCVLSRNFPWQQEAALLKVTHLPHKTTCIQEYSGSSMSEYKGWTPYPSGTILKGHPI